MTARSLLPLYQDRPDRVGRDRLEILTALIGGPSFDPVYRPDIIKVPFGHPVYRWECVVGECERARTSGTDVCSAHRLQWVGERDRGVGKAEFLTVAEPLGPVERATGEPCRICPGRPASPHGDLGLCRRHHHSWKYYVSPRNPSMDFEEWAADQAPCEGYGKCLVAVCPDAADSPLGLCSWHRYRYKKRGRPGGAALPSKWFQSYERYGERAPVSYTDEPTFREWCATTDPATRPGQINLRGLRPLLRAEIQWTLFAHTRHERHSRWDLDWIQRMANRARERDAGSLTDLDLADFPRFHGAIVKVMLHYLRLIYFTPSETRDAGFIESGHFGVRFPYSASHVDLTAVSQRWLRDLLWDCLAGLFRSPQCPRTRVPVDAVRRAATELSAFLEVEAPGGGHDPAELRVEHAQRFVADQRHREREGLPSLAMKGPGGEASIVSSNTRSVVANGVRKLLRDALESGTADRLGLDREFITAMPAAGGAPLRARRPFPDEVARALADEANLVKLAQLYDPEDRGLRDVWETIVITGRRVNEVLKVRWGCIGRYGGLAMFWHDQTKVGNYDAAIRIPERLYDILAERQRKTLDRFTAQHGRRPTGEEQAGLALFFSSHRNPDGKTSLSYMWFNRSFRLWLGELDIGHYVAHQARHTLATNLLRQGATLTHIRRYLGQVSERMAEHYVHLSHSDLENVLQHVWVAGPGTASPGALLAGESAAPLTREQAQAIAVDLARRSTPAEGGFCTFERRRRLDYTSLLPDAQWEDIRLRTERADHLQLSRRLAPHARHALFTRLSGLPFTRAPFPRSSDGHAPKTRLAAFITALTPELAAELTRVAEEFLAHHQIRDEPVSWQPPASLLNGLDLPGTDPASLDLNEVHKLARTDGVSAAAIARRLGTTSDAIQALLLDHPAPADPAGGARRRRARYAISREQFRDLHHGQGLSFTEIGQLTGYSRTAISDLARAYEIPTSTFRDGKQLKAPADVGD